MDTYKPKTRSTQLLVQELVDELLIYDVERNQVHCLNGSAMRVWALCDGERTVSEIARAARLGPRPARPLRALVWCALDQFTEKHLLEDRAGQATGRLYRPEDLTRRQMVLRLGLVVGLLPLVDSIVSPQAALAQSGGPATRRSPP